MLKAPSKQRDIIVIRLLAALFFLGTLVSCTTTAPSSSALGPSPTTKTTPSWEARQTALSGMNRFQLQGKIAVTTPKESGSASLNWSQNQGQYNVSIMGPMGSHSMKLVGGPGKITLEADGKRRSANNPESLLAKEWGYSLPVSSLQYWIRGIPVTGVPASMEWDSEKRLRSLTQQNAKVRYLAYVKVGSLDLPSKIFISSPSLETKIIIYRWNPIDTHPRSQHNSAS